MIDEWDRVTYVDIIKLQKFNFELRKQVSEGTCACICVWACVCRCITTT
jgi:hypothetical protein